MSLPRPIEIVGGGLAGLSLGLALRRAGVPASLYEAGEYPRHRVCGEFITGLDSTTSERLGLAPFLNKARMHRNVVWYHCGTVIQRQVLPAPALALSRYELDQAMAQAFVAAGGKLHTRSRLDPAAAPAGRVFAHGRRAVSGSPWIGLKCHARALPLTAELELHLGENAYVGLCPVEDGWINVSGLFRQRADLVVDRTSALTAYLRAVGLGALADRLALAEIDPASHCAVAGLAFGRSAPRSTDPRRLAIGDAHALIPPFTGNGMAMAFQSAALAVDPLIDWAHGRSEWPTTLAEVDRRLRGHFRRRLTTANLLHPALLRPLGQRMLSAAARVGVIPLQPLYQLLH